MAYLLSKVLTQLALPLGVGILLILAGGLALVFGRKSVGAGLSLVGALWIWVWATPVFSDWVRGLLEGQYAPVAIESLPTAGAVVVLGGGVQGRAVPRLFPNLSSSADRVWHAARLYHGEKAPLLVVSGGRQPWDEGQGPEAVAMLEFLTDLGVPEDRILLEGRSRNTYDNARETGELLAERGIERLILVTSAMHMPRAAATFRAAGMNVVPAPTDYEVTAQQGRTLLDFLPDAEALEGSSRAFREYLGLWVYRQRGWAVR
jgi:uncharacterized SAM-binding protein YcdF (DUF218 family)